MKRAHVAVLLLASGLSPMAGADFRQLVIEDVLLQIAEETSGEAAKKNLDAITLQHRMRASAQFESATQHIIDALHRYELDDVARVEFPADGRTMIGTQRSRPSWVVDSAELWEITQTDSVTRRLRRLADWDSVPLSLAQDSLSGEATATLVDVGAGTARSNYEGRDVRGQLVLTSSQPEAVVDLAVGEFGAAGIVSYAPNQKSAWWKEDDRLVRWGHLGSFPSTQSFAFMISLGEARRLQERLAGGDDVLLHARVEARHESGTYSFATATIEGASKPDELVHLSCHLDHPRPGANDNTSGCVAILEIARTLNELLKRNILPRPARSIRFLWPAEIEGSIFYLARFDDTSRIKANIHMDMVGGGLVTKSVFRISGGPASVPSFIADVGHEAGRFVNEQTEAYASGTRVAFPLIASEGGKEPLLALMEGLDMGSDHDVFFEGSWRIPGLYLHDWPDRYIHTNFDLAANIDPTKLKRAAFIGAVNAWFLANMDADSTGAVIALLKRNALERAATLTAQRSRLDPLDRAIATRLHFEYERQKLASIERFAEVGQSARARHIDFLSQLEQLVTETPATDPDHQQRNNIVFERAPGLPGPMWAFGYSYIEDKLGAGTVGELSLLTQTGDGRKYAYETLNFVDGRRSVSDIRDWLTMELGAVPVEYVAEYLLALESIGVLRRR